MEHKGKLPIVINRHSN